MALAASLVLTGLVILVAPFEAEATRQDALITHTLSLPEVTAPQSKTTIWVKPTVRPL